MHCQFFGRPISFPSIRCRSLRSTLTNGSILRIELTFFFDSDAPFSSRHRQASIRDGLASDFIPMQESKGRIPFMRRWMQTIIQSDDGWVVMTRYSQTFLLRNFANGIFSNLVMSSVQIVCQEIQICSNFE